jgi:hypothetical protein
MLHGAAVKKPCVIIIASVEPSREEVSSSNARWRLGLGFVAVMSHGVAARHCKPLKRNGNVLQQAATSKAGSRDTKLLILLAVPRGLEPPTFGLGNRCSIQLSYGTEKRISA